MSNGIQVPSEFFLTLSFFPRAGLLCFFKCDEGWWDGDKGTGTSGRACGDLGLWTRGRETRDAREGLDSRDGDAGTSNTGTQGTRNRNNYCKSRR